MGGFGQRVVGARLRTRGAAAIAVALSVLAVSGVVSAAGSVSWQLGNRVWVDVNGNGSREANEPGLAGVVMTLADTDGPRVVGVSAPGGWYGFDDLDAAGCYQLSIAIPAGYQPSPLGAAGSTTNHAGPTGAVPDPICGTDAAVQDQWDIGLVPASGTPAGFVGHIGNRVFDDQDGNGLKSSNEPGIGGVRVTLSNASGVPLVSGLTADGGWYGFSGLDESACYRLRVTIPSGWKATRADAGNDSLDSDIGADGVLTSFACLTPTIAAQDQWDAGLTVDTGGGPTTTVPSTTVPPVTTTTGAPPVTQPPGVPFPRPTLPSATATGIAAGENIGCAVVTGGTVRCWGFGGFGKLGDGVNVNSGDPVAVTGVTTATQVALTNFRGCALLSAGTISCWGADQRGNQANTVNPAALAKPAVGATGVTKIAGGGPGVCGIMTDRSVSCWLDASFGEQTGRLPVPGLTDVLQIAVGGYQSCAIRTDGSVWCWTMSQNGPTITTPTKIAGLGVATQVGIDRATPSACASQVGGEVMCWGNNQYGQLGDGTTTDSATPVLVSGLPPVRDLGVGGTAACVVVVDDTARCWGNYLDDPLHPFEAPPHLTPVTVAGLADAAEIEIAEGMTVALRNDGSVWVWRTGGLPKPITGLPSGTPIPGFA